MGATMAIAFACGNCGKAYRVDDRFAGKRAACKACQTINVIPALVARAAAVRAARAAAGAPARRESAAPVAHEAEAYDEFDPALAASLERPGAGAACPGCAAALGPEAVFCTGCGYDLRAGRQVTTTVVTGAPAAGPIANPYAASRAARGGGGDHVGGQRSFATTLLVMGMLAWVYPCFGYQLKVLAGLGGYAPLVGTVMLVIAAMLYVAEQRMGLAAVSGAGTLASLIVFATIGQSWNARDRDGDPVARVASADTDVLRQRRQAIDEEYARSQRPSSPVPQSIFDGPAPAQAPPAYVPPALSDFYHNGKAKVWLESAGGGIFTDAQIRTLPVPDGQDAVEFFRPGLRETDPRIRQATVRTLMNLPIGRRSAAAAAVADLVGDPDVQVRTAAVQAQAAARHDGSVAALIRALADADSAVREVAVLALAKTPGEPAVEPLVGLFPRHPQAVHEALAAFGPPYHEKIGLAFAAVAERKDQPNRRLTLDEVWAVCRAHAGPALVHFLDDADPALRGDALARLLELKYAPAADRIADRLGPDGPPAAAALVQLGAAGEKAALRVAAAAGDARARVAAFNVLKVIGTREAALEPAKAAAADDDLGVAKAAREVWRKLDPAALPAIDEALMDLATARADKQASALAALGTIKPDDKNRDAVAKRLFELATAAGDAALQAAARAALVAWATPDVRDAVVEAVKAGGDEARRTAVTLLAVDLKEARAVDPLCASLDQNPSSPATADALTKFGPASEDALTHLLTTTSNTQVAIKACQLLSAVGTRKCVNTLGLVALKARDRYPEVFAAAKLARDAVERRLGKR